MGILASKLPANRKRELEDPSIEEPTTRKKHKGVADETLKAISALATVRQRVTRLAREVLHFSPQKASDVAVEYLRFMKLISSRIRKC